MKMRQHRKHRQNVSREWAKVRTRHLKYLRICQSYQREPWPVKERSLREFKLTSNAAYIMTKIGVNSTYGAYPIRSSIYSAKNAQMIDRLIHDRIVNPPPRFEVKRVDYENGDLDKLCIVQPLPVINPWK